MELLLILHIVVLLFGASKIPKLARSSGQTIGEFKRGCEELEEELDELNDDEGEGRYPGLAGRPGDARGGIEHKTVGRNIPDFGPPISPSPGVACGGSFT